MSGDGKALMFVNLSPTAASANETVCSLRFANQVSLFQPETHLLSSFIFFRFFQMCFFHEPAGRYDHVPIKAAAKYKKSEQLRCKLVAKGALGATIVAFMSTREAVR